MKRQDPQNRGESNSLYAISRPSTTVPARPPRSMQTPLRAAVEDRPVFGFQASKWSIEHFPPRDDDDVKGGGWLVPPEQLPDQSLRAVPHDRSAQLAGGSHADAGAVAVVHRDEHRERAAVESGPSGVSGLELRTALDSLACRQALGHVHGIRQQATAATTRSDVSDPWRAAVSGRGGRFWYSSGRGSHESASCGGCSAETCAYPSAWRYPANRVKAERNPNPIGQLRACQRPVPECLPPTALLAAACVLHSLLQTGRSERIRCGTLGSVPEVFHTCGKNCGKAPC